MNWVRFESDMDDFGSTRFRPIIIRPDGSVPLPKPSLGVLVPPAGTTPTAVFFRRTPCSETPPFRILSQSATLDTDKIPMTTYRLRTFMRNTAPFPLRRLPPPCPSPSSAASSGPREGESGPGSVVYRHALRFQRPTTIRWQAQLANSASFIGSVLFPLRRVSTSDGRFGVSTVLRVHKPGDSGRGFRILLKMWDEMAETSWKHLRAEDFVYVSGQLGSYAKASEGGQSRTYYEVTIDNIMTFGDQFVV